jgi:hypothetical protein
VASLVAGCEPHLRGSVKSPQQQIAELEREVQRLRQQCARHLALARASQRTVGLPTPAKNEATGQGKVNSNSNSKRKSLSGKKRCKRRPTVRALKAAEVLRNTQPASASSIAETVSATTNPSSHARK